MRLVVVGNGVAGVTCALEVRKRDPSADITLVSGETDYFFSRTALMYAFMDRVTRRDLEPHERRTWDEQRIRRVRDWAVDLDAQGRTLRLKSGTTLPYDALVLAVGALARRAPWPGLEGARQGVVNLVSMQDLDACEALVPSTRQAVVVGGGLIGIELVECLVHHGVKTTFLVREPHYWPVALGMEESAMVADHLRSHGVDLRLHDTVARVDVDGAGRISGVQTAGGTTFPAQMLGVCIGVEPALERVRGFSSAPALGQGIRVDEGMRTSLPAVYACGDCTEVVPAQGRPFVELTWYAARRQAETCARSILGDKATYTPPVPFNSSRFFEIEFTTVGAVNDAPAGTPTLYRRWKDISQRIVHDGTRVLGFNMLGSRWDHEVLSRWITEARSLAYVREHLAEAQFDVELGRVPLDRFSEREIPLEHLAGAS